MNFVTWLKEIVFSSTIGLSNYANWIFSIFGCVIVSMTIGFIFKFLLKLMD